MQTPPILTKSHFFTLCCAVVIGSWASPAQAVSSAELYMTTSYQYGRFEARVQYAGGDGVVSSFFLWKESSEVSGVFWNELDFEKLWADCTLTTNPLYGAPEMSHGQEHEFAADLCGTFHTYAYEWTPDTIAWFMDGVEIRRESGEHAAAFRDNAPGGMRIHLNVWPGDETFGGNFNPAILPVHQYINWVQYYSYVDGAFQLEWREDFDAGSVPPGWSTGDWESPKKLSTHSPANVTFIDGYVVLSLTEDNATGSAGAAPMDTGQDLPMPDPEAEQEPSGEGGASGAPGDVEGEDTDGDPVVGAGGAGGSPSDEGAEPMDVEGAPAGSAGAGASPGAEPELGEMNGDGTVPSPVDTAEAPAPRGGGGAPPQAPTGGEDAPSTTPSVASPPATVVGTDTTAAVPDVNTPAAAPTLMESDAKSDTGCGCRVAAGTDRGWAGLWLALGWMLYRRRRPQTPRFFIKALLIPLYCGIAVCASTSTAHAQQSAELYRSAPYLYGRFEARMQFAFGDGVVSSFFLWKDGSEVAGVFWNELDFEKLRAACELETNALYGDPESVHVEHHESEMDLCGTFHTYTYEWTPDYIAWFIDGVEIRRETGEIATAYAGTTAEGMQLRFNVWPGDESFGGNFDPAILPVHQYVNWVQYSSYVDGGFQFEWREDFTAPTRPSGWAVGSWPSPKNLSTHNAANVSFIDGYAVLSLTADDATGPAGATPLDPEDTTDTPPGVGSAGAPGVDSAPGTTSGGGVPPGAGAPLPVESDVGGDGGGCSFRTPGAGLRPSWPWIALGLALSLGCVRRRDPSGGF
jgi:beta-glucanase (GH16 family)